MSNKQHRFELNLTYSEATGSWQVDNLNLTLFLMKMLGIVKYELYTYDNDYNILWVEL